MDEVDGLSDLDVVGRTIDGEAGNQGQAGQEGVGSVISTRVKLRWQGERTARGVCLHRAQFSCWGAGADRDRILGPDYITPAQCLAIAAMVLAGTLPDNTNGADSYEVTGTEAFWARTLTPVAVIGNQSFYITRKLPNLHVAAVEESINQPETKKYGYNDFED